MHFTKYLIKSNKGYNLTSILIRITINPSQIFPTYLKLVLLLFNITVVYQVNTLYFYNKLNVILIKLKGK